ncbi:MAG: symmetrical bis(5'-nucleosyl)-tetraphosphatase [Deltaproteobacteria bacterium]|nr:MAG: symmetrical bis(5'-nucleosyl)-tetraphosphatase [Deltaproteobacteria bacterium]
MATWVVGDVQGCNRSLMALLDAIDYRPGCDRLLFVGDLVNRGPGSLEVLRWAQQHAAAVVLGNHDLHLLAVAMGVAALRPGDTLEPVLSAPDRDALLGWLRHRPLLHVEGPFVLVHAGLLPAWDLRLAREAAAAVEAALRNEAAPELLRLRRTRQAQRWDPTRPATAQLRTALSALTVLRMVTRDGTMDLEYKGPPERAPSGLVPWYAAPGARWREGAPPTTILFGHWAAHGFADLDVAVCLDSGCVWGGSLTALRLEDRKRVQVPAQEEESLARP